MIVEDIADPLMHIIRNAIDHGIENPAERSALGKDQRGVIRLSSYRRGTTSSSRWRMTAGASIWKDSGQGR